MGFSSRRNKRGGDKIEDLQSQLDSIQSQVNELKNSSTGSEPVSESFSSMETISEPESSIVKTWVDDKNLKFKDGKNGRVNLSFNRIMTLLDNLIKKGDAGKDWVTIKSKLNL